MTAVVNKTHPPAPAHRKATKSLLRRPSVATLAARDLQWCTTALADWSAYLREVRGRSAATVERYRRLVCAALLDLGVSSLEEIDLEALDRHLRNLFLAGRSEGTRAGVVVALRSLFEWSCARGQIADNPAARLQGPAVVYRREAAHLTVPEVRALIGPPGRLPADPLAARDRVLLAVSYWAGLRAGEVGCIRVDQVGFDIEREVYSVLLRRSKWADQDRRIHLHEPEASRLLGAWLTIRPQVIRTGGRATCPWLWPSVTGGPLHRRTVAQVFNARRRAAGIDPKGRRLVFHSLRHSLATHLVQAGWEIPAVQEWMRHRSVETTMRYAHVTSGRLARLWQQRRPLAARRGQPVPDPQLLGWALLTELAGGSV